jgi:hypothetical protein
MIEHTDHRFGRQNKSDMRGGFLRGQRPDHAENIPSKGCGSRVSACVNGLPHVILVVPIDGHIGSPSQRLWNASGWIRTTEGGLRESPPRVPDPLPRLGETSHEAGVFTGRKRYIIFRCCHWAAQNACVPHASPQAGGRLEMGCK